MLNSITSKYKPNKLECLNLFTLYTAWMSLTFSCNVLEAFSVIDSMEVYLTKRLLQSSSSEEESDVEHHDKELGELEFLDYIGKRTKRVKIINYVNNVVNQYSDMDFQAHFRITKSSFEELLQILQNDTSEKEAKPGRPPTSLNEALLLTIWTLATPESFRSIGDRFGLNKGHAYRLFIKMCHWLSSKAKEFISWPSTEKIRKSVSEFNNLRGPNSFPGVIGCIDGTHIKILGPENDNSYYNRKGYHSILLQAICNAKQEFLNVFCGWPGSSTDARVWTNCGLFDRLQNGSLTFPPNTYLLGDSGYPLSKNLIVPFRDNGHLSRKQRKFNQKLSSTRVVIEQSFGRLKGQFRRLKYIESTNIPVIKSIVLSCCALHNISIRSGVEYDESENASENDDTETEDNCDYESSATQDARDFRNQLMDKIITCI